MVVNFIKTLNFGYFKKWKKVTIKLYSLMLKILSICAVKIEGSRKKVWHWMGEWVDVGAGLRIAYSNKKHKNPKTQKTQKTKSPKIQKN